MTVTVNPGTAAEYQYEQKILGGVGNSFAIRPDANSYIGILGVGDAQSFNVTAKFLNLDTDGTQSNVAKGESTNFDLIVKAVQITDASLDPNPQA